MSPDHLTALAGGTSLLIVLLVALGWLWIYRKTGSSHASAMRIWRVLTGGREIADKAIRDYIEEQDGLMAFRLGSGMRVRSAEHARRAICFIAKHDLSPDRLRQVGDYFDANELKMGKLPSFWYRVWLFFSATVLAGLFLVAGFTALEQRTLVSLKQTGSWYWLSQTSAEPVGPVNESARLWFSACSEAPAATATYTSEREILCSIRRDPAYLDYLIETLRGQRIALVFLMVISFFVAIWQWRDFLRSTAAIRLEKELSEKLAATSPDESVNAEPAVDDSAAIDPA